MGSLEIKWTHLNEVLNALADEVIQKAREKLDANGSNATHNLYDTLEKIVEIGDDAFSVKISLADYWKYVEEGTGPAHLPDARGQYWPKIEPLKEWVQNKPGVPKDEAFAYAVRGKIHKEGIKPRPFLEPAKDEVLARYEPLIDQAIQDDIYAFIDESVMNLLKDALR